MGEQGRSDIRCPYEDTRPGKKMCLGTVWLSTRDELGMKSAKESKCSTG